MLRRRMGQRLSRAKSSPSRYWSSRRLWPVTRQLERLVHELDAEVEGVPGGYQAIEAIQGLGPGSKARFDRR